MTSCSKHITRLLIPVLSDVVSEADTFADFLNSLMRVGKTADTSNVSIFTKDGVTVHREAVLLITFKDKPIMVGKHNECSCYSIPLLQHHSQRQPHHPSKQARKTLWQANSIYNLPSTEQAINGYTPYTDIR